VKRGTEPKARTSSCSTARSSGRARIVMRWLAVEVLRMRFRDVLREELGWHVRRVGEPVERAGPAPGVPVPSTSGRRRSASTRFAAAVFREIDAHQARRPDAEEIEKVREMQRRGEETEVRQNGSGSMPLASAASTVRIRDRSSGARAARDRLTPRSCATSARKYLERVALCAGATPTRVVSRVAVPQRQSSESPMRRCTLAVPRGSTASCASSPWAGSCRPSQRTVAVDDQQVYRTTVLANAKAPFPPRRVERSTPWKQCTRSSAFRRHELIRPLVDREHDFYKARRLRTSRCRPS
jgi:hypothetical protein